VHQLVPPHSGRSATGMEIVRRRLFVAGGQSGSLFVYNASFEGTVKGLPGVTRYWGKGSLLVSELLYDAAGNVIGSDQPEILTSENGPHTIDCDTAAGFTYGTFAATVDLFG